MPQATHNHYHHLHLHHHHTPKITSLHRAFIIGIVLNLAYVVFQVVVGLKIHSLALLSDAGHNFLDVAGLGLAMLAFKLAQAKATPSYTYGYKKASILISLFNALVLLISIGAIGYESVKRFAEPQPLAGKTIAAIALLGIIVNGVSALLFFRDRKNDLNVKSAFLHLAADALVSLGMVIGGLLIYYTKLYWIDSLLSIIICLTIVISTWHLLQDSVRLSLDGVPNNVNVKALKTEVLSIKHVKDFKHIHVWALSTTQNALTANLIAAPTLNTEEINALQTLIKQKLHHFNVHHSTIEISF